RGTVSDANSLVGSNPGDGVGGFGVTRLSNGNYLVRSANWNGNRGAVTWGDGGTGGRGTVSEANSLAGSNPGDRVGDSDITRLSNGNYVVSSSAVAGAASSGHRTTGVNGTGSDANSLVGTGGFLIITPLSNGNYVVQSPLWNGQRGAVTWGDG